MGGHVRPAVAGNGSALWSDIHVAIFGDVDSTVSGVIGQHENIRGRTPATAIMSNSDEPADEGGHDHAGEEHDDHRDHNDIDEDTVEEVTELVQAVQDAADDLRDDVPPEIFRRLDHLEGAIEAIEDWADDAEPDQGVDALAGAKTIVDAEQERAETLRNEAPSGNVDLLQQFEVLEDALEDLEDTVDAFTFGTTSYVVYMNRQFVARYTTDDVSVETILEDAGKQDPDELGLFPLDGITGDRQTDQAFPADRELDLDESYRTFFESTSDGGKIAHE